jgi:hypothetical protein
MSTVGTSSSRTAQGKNWNQINAFRCGDGSTEFQLTYEDPETHRIRFVGTGDNRRPDILRFRLDDYSARAVLASLLTDSIASDMHIDAMRDAIARESL